MNKTKVKSENYLTIQGWMITELGLSGNELLCYALIFGFCQDEESCFAGSSAYIAEWLNISRASVFAILKKLCDKGLLKKIEKQINGVKLCDYQTLHPVKKLDRGYKETLQGGYKETLHHIDNEDIYKDNNKEKIHKKEIPCTEKSAYGKISTINNTYFDEFWALYTPIKSNDGKFVAKGNKSACQKKFERLLKEGVKYETIINGLKQYLFYCKQNGYCSCGAEVFLNQRRFENDYSENGTIQSRSTTNSSKESPSIIDIAREFIAETSIQNKNNLY